METRRERKERQRQERTSLLKPFLACLLLVAVAIPVYFVFKSLSFPAPESPLPEVPRLVPFLAPLEGGPERRNRVKDLPGPLKGIVRRLPTDERLFAITFDDGPDPVSTPRLLKILEEEGVVATFFLIGNRASSHPELVTEIVAQGHEIGNHTLSHPRLTELTEESVRYEIERAQAVLTDIVDTDVTLFRPPYGRINDFIQGVAQKAGLRTILWSVDSRDWEGISETRIVGNVLPYVEPGSIIIMHCSGGTSEDFTHTLDALPGILRRLHNRGYSSVTVGEILQR